MPGERAPGFGATAPYPPERSRRPGAREFSRHIVFRLALLLVFAGAGGAAGCAGEPNEPEDDPPDISGVITAVDEDRSTVQIDEDPAATAPDDPRGDKMVFVVTARTEIWVRDQPDSVSPGSFADLEAGKTAKGWYTGIPTSSYPRMAEARRVEIVR